MALHVPPENRPTPAFLPFSEPTIGEEEITEVLACLRSGWLSTGPRAARFEADFARYVGSRHAVAVNSGTAALHLALEAVGVGPGDEVVTSPMTFTATAAAIQHLGAVPVLADCDPQTLNLDVARAAERITARTRAILPVHFAGQACDMGAILDLARAHGLAVVEDAAHALPASHRGHRIGTLGDATCFSFHEAQAITTGEGGMITTDRADLAERARVMRLHGMNKDAWKRFARGGAWSYDIVAPGFKDNLPDLAAALGIAQLRRCDAFRARRAEIARTYNEAFAVVPGLIPPVVEDEAGHAWHLYVLRLDPERLAIDRGTFLQRLGNRGIGVSVHFIPLHLHTFWRERYGYEPDDFPVALAAFKTTLSLPIYPKMTDADVARVIRGVRDVAEGGWR